jgi:hypothetical protein
MHYRFANVLPLLQKHIGKHFANLDTMGLLKKKRGMPFTFKSCLKVQQLRKSTSLDPSLRIDHAWQGISVVMNYVYW